MYDVIIVGARVAGSSTGMLLARKGYKVLVADRASFPSDTISSHQVQIPGIARLKRWGLLDQLIATQAPATRHVSFDAGFTVFDGVFPAYEGQHAMYSPRRTYLDKILVDAARQAGAEVREGFIVEDILSENGAVTGVSGRSKTGGSLVETAKIVIGADGKHSLLAQAVKAPVYNEKPVMSCAYYAYFSGLPVLGGELYLRDRLSVGVWPTNDSLSLVFVARPAAEFDRIRSDVEKNFIGAIDQIPTLAGRVRAARREERIYGTADMPNFYRKPYGPGWALVGDAGFVKDAISGQGIGDAFRDAESLSDAIDAGLSGKTSLEAALIAHENTRNQATLPMYELTAQLASFESISLDSRLLFEGLQSNKKQASRFFGVTAGIIPVQEFFNPGNLVQIVGFTGMVRMMAARAGARFVDALPLPIHR